LFTQRNSYLLKEILSQPITRHYGFIKVYILPILSRHNQLLFKQNHKEMPFS